MNWGATGLVLLTLLLLSLFATAWRMLQDAGIVKAGPSWFESFLDYATMFLVPIALFVVAVLIAPVLPWVAAACAAVGVVWAIVALTTDSTGGGEGVEPKVTVYEK